MEHVDAGVDVPGASLIIPGGIATTLVADRRGTIDVADHPWRDRNLFTCVLGCRTTPSR
ncbi:hypothetical protein FRACA_910018 [Frankia canadensis]|uniref:Uncharacterized protein n=1 Tax=Frankia canadensis TaxID=1836972 RepID=A0A2I2L2F0_9ACTN|nr:hypothetical protein FRACA_910018 [Frankia canadensis]SOU59396.1 hypothetical protein FRACA_910018 [Frankia canadensis]